MTKKNSILIFPPSAYPISPYLAVPLLVGQIKAAGYECSGRDYNVIFHNDILTFECLSKSAEKAKSYLKDLSKTFGNTADLSKTKGQDQLFLLKKQNIENFFKQNPDYQQILDYIDRAVGIVKSEEFYNPDSAVKAIQTIIKGLEIFFLPYSPHQTYLTTQKPYFSMNCDDIIFQCTHKDFNPFIEYFENKIITTDFKNINFAGISIPYATQLIPALTLAKELKSKTSAHVNLGGNLITRVKEAFIDKCSFFSDYFDSLIFGEGENAIAECVKYVNGNLAKEAVNGLYCRNQNGNIINNPSDSAAKICNRNPVDFNGLKFGDYFTPEIIMPVQFSKGCYWGRCTFCDISYGKPHYDTLSPEAAVNIAETLKKKYNICKFEIIDESISPDVFDKLTDIILEKNLNIKFFAYARLEENFDKNLLKKLRKAGLHLVQWGYETGSEKVLSEMNKGINPKTRLKILSDANDCGIWNQIMTVVGFPTETEEDLLNTLNDFIDNKDIMNSIVFHKFKLEKHSCVNSALKNFNIESVENKEEFSPCNSYKKIKYYPDSAEKKEKNKTIKSLIINDLWLKLICEEYIFLYLCRYSTTQLKNQKCRDLSV